MMSGLFDAKCLKNRFYLIAQKIGSRNNGALANL